MLGGSHRRLNAPLAVALVAVGSAACGSSHPALDDGGGTGSTAGSSGTSGTATSATTSALTSAGSTGTSSSASTSGGNATTTGLTTGGSTGSASTGGEATITGGATGSPSGSGTSSGSGTGTGTTGSTGNGAEGALPCDWVGDNCLPDCRYAPVGTPCALDGGGFGVCYEQNCVAADPSSDDKNCGYLGLPCPPAYHCSHGSCGAINCTGGAGCPTGTTCVFDLGCVITDCSVGHDDDFCGGPGFCCNGTCLQASTNDSSNCGGCAVQCPAGTFCVSGLCVPQAQCTANQNTSLEFCEMSPGVPGTCCGGKCVDLTADPNNCGSCGSGCCSGATCGSPGCFQTCAYDGGCADGHAWSGRAQRCLPSQCGANDEGIPCTDPATGQFGFCCGGSCASSATNCGGCGIVCPSGSQCEGDLYCVSSVCNTGDTCFVGSDSWTCCAGECVDPASDANNCGGCGLTCPVGGICAGYGFCIAADTGKYDACESDGDCPPGTACVGGSCATVGCDAGNAVCALGGDGDGGTGICCDGVCSSMNSNDSCAACGIRCPSDFHCDAGSCYDGDGDALRCASDSCLAGELCFDALGCVPPTCGPGREGAYCALNSGSYGSLGTCCNGACIDDFSDPQNCGGCGFVCPSNLCLARTCFTGTDGGQCLQTCGEGTICAGADCVGSICASSPSYCLAQDGQLGLCCNGCVDIANDPLNCGWCNLICTGGTTCQNGLCNGDSACGAGHVGNYCNLDAGFSFLCCPGLGCIDTSADSQNCGGCGVVCEAAQSCSAGACG